MIERLTITGVHVEVGSDLHKYIVKKIGKLDSYIPRRARGSAHGEVILKENKVRNKNNCTCEVVLHLPHDTITTKETTLNMFAAVDIVEAKLKNQLKKYKEKHSGPRFARRIISRLKRSGELPV